MPERSEEDFDKSVSEASKLIIDKLTKGFYLCDGGVEIPRIPFPSYRFRDLPALDALLMEWGRKETCAKNEGYSAWHSKFLAACCYLLHNSKEGNAQTTVRTNRCAVVMINQILFNIHRKWRENAFSIWPALAMKGYLLASVGRHAEPVRRAIISTVSTTLIETYGQPRTMDYRFDPVRLMSALTGIEQQAVADRLKLPIQDQQSWSWADLGLFGLHEHAANLATTIQTLPINRPFDHRPAFSTANDHYRSSTTSETPSSIPNTSFSTNPRASSLSPSFASLPISQAPFLSPVASIPQYVGLNEPGHIQNMNTRPRALTNEILYTPLDTRPVLTTYDNHETALFEPDYAQRPQDTQQPSYSNTNLPHTSWTQQQEPLQIKEEPIYTAPLRDPRASTAWQNYYSAAPSDRIPQSTFYRP